MCIFTGPVENVSNTKILVAAIQHDHCRQMTVYENNVETKNPNTMVLPVPSGQSINFVDLSKYPGDVFKECDTFFPQLIEKSGGGSFGFGFSEAAEYLVIEKVGGYECSIANSIDQMKKADPNVFVLPDNIEEVLRRHYSEGFSFIICKFGNAKISKHPIAYTSSRLRNGNIFIPTRHEHGEAKKPNIYESFGDVVHTGFNCDVCDNIDKKNIVGTRYNCSYCNYDMCSNCYNNPNNNQHRHHPFIEFKRSKEFYDEQNVTKPEDDLFDHTLYLFNCVLIVPSKRYGQLEEKSFGERFKNTSVSQNFWSNIIQTDVVLRAQRVTIKGSSFENGDYYAAVVAE